MRTEFEDDSVCLWEFLFCAFHQVGFYGFVLGIEHKEGGGDGSEGFVFRNGFAIGEDEDSIEFIYFGGGRFRRELFFRESEEESRADTQ